MTIVKLTFQIKEISFDFVCSQIGPNLVTVVRVIDSCQLQLSVLTSSCRIENTGVLLHSLKVEIFLLLTENILKLISLRNVFIMLKISRKIESNNRFIFPKVNLKLRVAK